MTMLDQPYQIAGYGLAQLKSIVSLQCKGLGRRGRSALSLAKDHGYKGNCEKVLAQLTADVEAHIAYCQALNAGYTALELRELAAKISPAGRSALVAMRHPAFPDFPNPPIA